MRNRNHHRIGIGLNVIVSYVNEQKQGFFLKIYDIFQTAWTRRITMSEFLQGKDIISLAILFLSLVGLGIPVLFEEAQLMNRFRSRKPEK